MEIALLLIYKYIDAFLSQMHVIMLLLTEEIALS